MVDGLGCGGGINQGGNGTGAGTTSSTPIFGDVSGALSNTLIMASPSVPVTTYIDGGIYIIRPDDNVPGGATTLNIDGAGAKDVVRFDTTDPQTGDMLANIDIPFIYDANNDYFQSMSLMASEVSAIGTSIYSASGTITGTTTVTAAGSDQLIIENDSTRSDSLFALSQLGTGDVGIQLGVVAQKYYLAIDNSDGDKLKIGAGTVIGTTPFMTFDATGLAQLGVNLDTNGNNIIWQDDDKALFGTGSDASILYDGDDLIINPQEVGSGNLLTNLTGGKLGVGVAAGDMDGFIHAFGSGVGSSVPMLRMDAEGTTTHTQFHFYNASTTINLRNIFQSKHSSGTIASPTNSQASAKVFSIQSRAFADANYRVNADMTISTGSGFGSGDYSGKIVFSTVGVGSTTNLERLVVDDDESIRMFNIDGLMIGTDAVPAAMLHVDQSSTTGAIPVLTLDQADISEEMISFETTIGTGNPIEAIAAKTLTTTHFIKVTIPGGLTRYIPCGTIA